MLQTLGIVLVLALLPLSIALPASPPSQPVAGRAFSRFVTIWLGKQDFDKAASNAHVHALAKEGVLLNSFYALTHPAQPNYLASISGDYFGLNHEGFVQVPENVSTLVDLFDEAPGDLAWRFYGEGIPGPGYMGARSSVDGRGGLWDYVREHNPFVSFDSITFRGTRLLNIVSLADFYRDLAAERLPNYAFIAPDVLNDGHNTTLDYATAWSENFLMPLLSNEYFMNDTLVLLTFDESETHSKPNKVASLLLGGAIPDNLKGTTDTTFYTHYSILATLENNWGLSNLGRYDVGANVFDVVAQKTGYKNLRPSDKAMQMVDLSVSYGGSLNDDAAMFRPIPPPNLQLTGAGGLGVSQSVQENWAEAANDTTPYDGRGWIWMPLNYVAQAPAPG